MKKRALILFFFSCFFFLPGKVSARGGFYMLDGLPGAIYSGGTVLIDWRDFEPAEGQYRWDILFSETGGYVPWLGVFNKRIKSTSEDPWQPNLYGFFKQLRQNGQKVRFKLRVTEGAVPLWLYGGEDVNGKVDSSYGTICAYKTYEQAWAKEPDCNPNTDIVIAMTYPLYPTKEDNAEPVWWNPIFQAKYKKVLTALGQRIEADPVLAETIEFFEASVGSYGEMILYGKSDTFETDSSGQRLFKRAGYTNAKYANAVKDILGYSQEGFRTLPVALSLGSGLYASPLDDGSGVNSVMTEVVPTMTEKYGSKLYLKFAGFGMGRGGWVGNLFREHCPHKTRCIYESASSIPSWPGWPWNDDPSKLEEILNWAVEDKAYILMLWWADMRAINNGHTPLAQAFDRVRPRLLALGAIELPPFPSVYPTATPGTLTPSPTFPPPSPTSLFSPTPSSISPTKRPTPTPALRIDLAVGWNEISWLMGYPTNKKFSDSPAACPIVEVDDNHFLRVYVRGFGGEDLPFLGDRTYFIKCDAPVSWVL